MTLMGKASGSVFAHTLIADRIYFSRIGKDKRKVFTNDLEVIEDVISIIQAMGRFLAGEKLTRVSSDGRSLVSELGKEISSLLEYDCFALRQALEGSRGHPYLSVMEKLSDAYRDYDIFDWACGGRAAGLQALEEYVRLDIQRECSADVLRNSARSVVRGVRKNYASLDAFLSEISAKEKFLNAVSVDLRYIHEGFYGGGERHSAESVKKDLDTLLKVVEKSFPESISEYFWRLEFGLSRRFYARVVFFVESSSVKSFFSYIKEQGANEMLRISQDCYLTVYDFLDGNDLPGDCIGSGALNIQRIKDKVALLLSADEFMRVDFARRRVFGKSGMRC